MSRHLIVTHHAPDLDACGAVWLLKRFVGQHFADAKIVFVNPGETISLEAAEEMGCQLHEVTHVDTGLGEFDHHQPDRGLLPISASSLVYDHVVKIHPDQADNHALTTLVKLISHIDHFGEASWPEAEHERYCLMIHDLIRGAEFVDPHNDDSQLHFGLQCLDHAYAVLVQFLKARELIESDGIIFSTRFGECLAIETKNDDTIKVAQKKGYQLVIKKDPEQGNARIKARPDAPFDLRPIADAITKVDTKGTWYYHPSGKMLLNGSQKHRNQTATPLSLSELIELVKTAYA